MIVKLALAGLMFTSAACASPEHPGDSPSAPQTRAMPGAAVAAPSDRNTMAQNTTVNTNSNQNKSTSGKLVIMEFTDLECPDSAKYSSSLKSQIINQFVSSGAVEYEFHDFPLDSHPNARQAAAAARCAGDKVGNVRAAILQSGGNVESALASAGVNGQSVQACIASGASLRAVDADRALGNSLGVRGTPTLIVGQRQADGTVKALKTLRPDKTPGTIIQEIAALTGRR